MPTYLCHGFRWERQTLRGWVVINDVEEAAPDWIVSPTSARAMLSTMAEIYPYIPFGPGWRLPEDEDDVSEGESPDGTTSDTARRFADQHRGGDYAEPALEDSPVHLLEEFRLDENAVDVKTRPYAYVADHVVRVDLGADIAEEMKKYAELPKRGEEGWFEKLMLGLRIFGDDTHGLGWHVVICDDEERHVGSEEDEESDSEEIVGSNGRNGSEKQDLRKQTRVLREKSAGSEKGVGHELKTVLPFRSKERS